MNLEHLPADVREHLCSAIGLLGITEEQLGFWEVSDYGIFLLLTESFYKTLNYRKAEPADFLARRPLGKLPHKGSYPDSRAYMLPLIRHFRDRGVDPCILDVGGYIGRFSLESALLVKELGLSLPICCFEPGLTGAVIKANLAANGVDSLVSLRDEAASDTNGIAEYKYAPGVLISGRICSFPSATAHRTVPTIRLESVLSQLGCRDGAIIKIDTEGHEPSVMRGLGDLADSLPMACIVEFWPATLRETVSGLPYADFIEENFYAINIRSSLYPKSYSPIRDIRQFAADFRAEEGNVDLLFVSKAMPNCERLVCELCSLEKPSR